MRPAALANIYQLYLYDSSAWEDEPVGDDGLFEVPADLTDYVLDVSKSAHWIKRDGEIAGFLLTEQVEIYSGPIDECADLFILKRHRGKGVSLEVVRRTLAQVPRRRLVSIAHADHDARAFWRKAFEKLPVRSVRQFVDDTVPWLDCYVINER